MKLIKGGLADKAGMKCELNIHTATRNDHIDIRTGYPDPFEERKRNLEKFNDAREMTGGNTY